MGECPNPDCNPKPWNYTKLKPQAGPTIDNSHKLWQKQLTLYHTNPYPNFNNPKFHYSNRNLNLSLLTLIL